MKNIIIGIIIGGIIFTLGGVVAATTISSKNVIYQTKTVNNALDELYNEATTGKELVAAAITNKGITTASTDTYETMATNINSIDTDHTEINQKLSNLESKHNSDIASLTGSISSLNQSLTLLNEEIEKIKSIAVEFSGTTDNTGDLKMPDKYSFKNGYYILGAYLYQDNMICTPFHGSEPNYLHITNLSSNPVPNTAFSGVAYFIKR